MYERAGYSTLFGRIRENVRTLIRRQIELPKQEIAEIVRANMGAAKLLAIAAVLGLLFLVSFVVLLIAGVAALLAIWLPFPVALLASAVAITLLLALFAGLIGFRGYRSLELRGPTRSIDSLKETVTWAKARLLGRSES